jgi:nitrogen fixation/metabolism regulation signal transduction histidine kinase
MLKHFRFQCIFRILFLTATILAILLLWLHRLQTTLIPILILFACFQTYKLIVYVEKTNRDVTQFLEAIRYDDFSQVYRGKEMGDSHERLRKSFNQVLQKFQETRAEKEEHFRYLQTVVQHIGIALISFTRDGEVELINNAAKKLLRVPRLRNISALASLSPPLVTTLRTMKSGDKKLIKIEDNDELLQLMIYSTEFILHEQRYTLVSIQNIQSELEEKEMEAWQNLIRVLTHEIMNSVTPIASLASTTRSLLTRVPADSAQSKESADLLEDVRSATDTIEKRSRGLLHFVESYRKLTRISRPNFQIITVAELFERVKQLMSPQIAEKKILWNISIDPKSLELTADPEMVEQVLINLIMNAIHAVEHEENGVIRMSAHMDARGHPSIQVADNGPGIHKEVQEKIFIPFFTTKKGGTGIGLSLSRQIMRMHSGSITVQSRPSQETVFTLRF